MQREAVVQAGWYSHVSPNETLDHMLQTHKDRRVALEVELARELELARERQHQ